MKTASMFLGMALGLGAVSQSANSSEFLFESKNYDAKHVNQDQSITLEGPKFSNAGEGGHPISKDSNMDGVCKLFGLGTALPNSLIHKWVQNSEKQRPILINEKGTFGGFDYTSYAIDWITCNPPTPVAIPTSENYAGKFLNDDGSTTIKGPRFGMSGRNMTLSIESDLGGVCRLYGLSEYVKGSVAYDKFHAGVLIDANSRFERYTLKVNRSFYYIDSLICR